MSDLSQISEDTTNKNEQQEETSLINSKIENFIIKSFSFFFILDQSKLISTSDQKSLSSANDFGQNHINKIENELEINESVKTTEDESSDEYDSEYEDVEEDKFDKIDNTSVLISITNKNSFKVKIIIFHFISFYFSVILDNYG